MKRFMILTLIFAILAGYFTVLLADTKNRNVHQYWGRCSAEHTDGPLSAEVYIDVNIEHPGEKGLGNNLQGLLFGYGIKYEAYAKVKGKAREWNFNAVNDYEGEYECYAWVPYDEDHKPRERWQVKVDEDVKANDSISLEKDAADWSDEERQKYTNWNIIQANTDLSLCTAWGDLDGSSPELIAWKWVEIPVGESGSETRWFRVRDWDRSRPALSNDVYANAWNFPNPGSHNRQHEN